MILQCQPLAEAHLPLAAAPSLHWAGWAVSHTAAPESRTTAWPSHEPTREPMWEVVSGRPVYSLIETSPS